MVSAMRDEDTRERVNVALAQARIVFSKTRSGLPRLPLAAAASQRGLEGFLKWLLAIEGRVQKALQASRVSASECFIHDAAFQFLHS